MQSRTQKSLVHSETQGTLANNKARRDLLHSKTPARVTHQTTQKRSMEAESRNTECESYRKPRVGSASTLFRREQYAPK